MKKNKYFSEERAFRKEVSFFVQKNAIHRTPPYISHLSCISCLCRGMGYKVREALHLPAFFCTDCTVQFLTPKSQWQVRNNTARKKNYLPSAQLLMSSLIQKSKILKIFGELCIVMV